jgi:hypothetical protein
VNRIFVGRWSEFFTTNKIGRQPWRPKRWPVSTSKRWSWAGHGHGFSSERKGQLQIRGSAESRGLVLEGEELHQPQSVDSVRPGKLTQPKPMADDASNRTSSALLSTDLRKGLQKRRRLPHSWNPRQHASSQLKQRRTLVSKQWRGRREPEAVATKSL